MKKFLTLLLIISPLCCGYAQSQLMANTLKKVLTEEDAIEKKQNKDLFFEEVEFDFGTIVPNSIVNHTFTFTNKANYPISIISAKGSCGCTVAEYAKEPVLANQTSTLNVEFSAKGKTGEQVKTVTIRYQNANNLNAEITTERIVIKTNIPETNNNAPKSDAHFTIKNNTCNFNKVNEGKTVYHTFKFKNTGTETLKISEINCGCGCKIIKYTKNVAPNKNGKIVIEFNTAGRFGKQHRNIYIDANTYLNNTLVLEGIVLPINNNTWLNPLTCDAPKEDMTAKTQEIIDGSVKVFPTLIANEFTVQLGSNISRAKVQIFSIDGEQLQEENIISSTKIGVNLPAGTYVIRISTPQGNKIERIVVQ